MAEQIKIGQETVGTALVINTAGGGGQSESQVNSQIDAIRDSSTQLTFPNGQTNRTISSAEVTAISELSTTYAGLATENTFTDNQTITANLSVGNTSVRVASFLSDLEGEGGLQTINVTAQTPFSDLDTLNLRKIINPDDELYSNIFSVRTTDPSNIVIASALGNYYLIYTDINNWYLFETATFAGGQYFNTNVLASVGGFVDGAAASFYSNTTNFNVLDFLTFFDTNTPVDTNVPWDPTLGRDFVETGGDTERVVAELVPGFGVPQFDWVATEGEYAIGDIVRIRVYGQDADQLTDTPVIDVRKQIGLFSSTAFSGDLGVTSDRPQVIFTQAGVDAITPVAIETGPTTAAGTAYYLSTDQVRIDRSSQVVAQAFSNPTDIVLDGRADIGELVTEGQVVLNNTPTVDPLVTNEVWSDNGHLALSGATPLELGITSVEVNTQIDAIRTSESLLTFPNGQTFSGGGSGTNPTYNGDVANPVDNIVGGSYNTGTNTLTVGTGGTGDTITLNFALVSRFTDDDDPRTYCTIIEPTGAGTTGDMANWRVVQNFRSTAAEGSDANGRPIVMTRTYTFTDVTSTVAYQNRDTIRSQRANSDYDPTQLAGHTTGDSTYITK